MKRAIVGSLLILCAAGLPLVGNSFAQKDDSFLAFWQKFKTAVSKRDRRAVGKLTTFPLVVAEKVPNVQNSAELTRRFGEVFDKQTNAAQCFASRQPTADTENAGRFTISCPVEKDIFVAYEFERTAQGWRFIHRLFPTNCPCR